MGEAALLVVGRFERVRLRLEDLEHLILREREARRLALRSEEGILDEGAAAAGSRGGGWLRSAIRRAQFATPAPPSSPGRVGAAVRETTERLQVFEELLARQAISKAEHDHHRALLLAGL